jgi:serine protease inhibitor
MNLDNKELFKLYESVANLGPGAESPVGPSSNQQVVVSVPSGFATKDTTQGKQYAPQENEEDYSQDRKDMVSTNLITINKSLKSIAEDFRKMKDVPPWVQNKIAYATQYIEDVADYYDGRTGD